MRRGSVEPIDPDIMAGVKDGLEATERLRNPALEQYTNQSQATEINVMVQAVMVAQTIKEVELDADDIGAIALIHPVVALEYLGGEAEARETMGDEATDKLLAMIVEHPSNDA